MTETNLELFEQIRSILHMPPEDVADFADQFQPYDFAEAFDDLEHDDQLRLLSKVSPVLAAEIIQYLEPLHQYQLLDHVDETITRAIVNELPSDVLADTALAIHPRQADQLLQRLPDEQQEKIRALMRYPENTAGGLAAVDYVVARAGWTAERALAHVQKVAHDAEIISYVYVLNTRGQLVGVMSLRQLILASPWTPIDDLASPGVVSVDAMADQEQVAQVLSQYDLLALPVVTEDKRMIGIVTVDDVIDVIEEEATEDFHKAAAVTPLREGYQESTIWSLFRKRIGWLLILVLVNLASSGVIAAYEDVLSATIALAFFIPLLIDSGGNAGAQSATLMVRSLATGDTKMNQWGPVALREIAVGLSLGLTMAAATWVLGVFRGGLEVGYVVALSMAVIVVMANVIGITLPFLLTRFRLDPAVASSPLITTIVDAAGLLVYFSVAAWLLTVM